MNRLASGRLMVALVVAMLCTTTGCAMARPSAEIVGVKLQDVGLAAGTLLFDVKVDNPYGVPLAMSDVDYALSSRGQQFLNGKAESLGTVPAGESRTVGVPVRVDYLKLVNLVQGARPGVTIPYTADMGLSVDVPLVGPLRLPMSRDGELTIPAVDGLLDRLKSLPR